MEQEEVAVSQTETMGERVERLNSELEYEPQFFCGEMYCKKCKSFVKVRYDVYLARLVKGQARGLDEKQVNRAYLCSKCRNGHSAKKEDFVAMIKGKDD